MRFLYVVRWKPRNGRDGGYGTAKTFKTIARTPGEAAKKLRSSGQVVGVRKLRRA